MEFTTGPDVPYPGGTVVSRAPKTCTWGHCAAARVAPRRNRDTARIGDIQKR